MIRTVTVALVIKNWQILSGHLNKQEFWVLDHLIVHQVRWRLHLLQCTLLVQFVIYTAHQMVKLVIYVMYIHAVVILRVVLVHLVMHSHVLVQSAQFVVLVHHAILYLAVVDRWDVTQFNALFFTYMKKMSL